MDSRELKALELAARAKIVANDDGTWAVPSQSAGGTYRVVTWPGAESCQCEDFQLRQQPCKHVTAVRTFVALVKASTPAPTLAADIFDHFKGE